MKKRLALGSFARFGCGRRGPGGAPRGPCSRALGARAPAPFSVRGPATLFGTNVNAPQSSMQSGQWAVLGTRDLNLLCSICMFHLANHLEPPPRIS